MIASKILDLLAEMGVDISEEQLDMVVEKVEMKRRKNRPFVKGVASDKHRLVGSKYLGRYGYGRRSAALRRTLHVDKKLRSTTNPRKFVRRTIKNDISDYLGTLGIKLNEEQLHELDQSTYANMAKRRYAMGVAHQALGNSAASAANHAQSRKIEQHAMGKGERVKRSNNIRFLGKRVKPEAKFFPKPVAPPVAKTASVAKKKPAKKVAESFINEAIKRVRDKKRAQDNPDVRLTPMVHGIQAGMSMTSEEFTNAEE